MITQQRARRRSRRRRTARRWPAPRCPRPPATSPPPTAAGARTAARGGADTGSRSTASTPTSHISREADVTGDRGLDEADHHGDADAVVAQPAHRRRAASASARGSPGRRRGSTRTWPNSTPARVAIDARDRRSPRRLGGGAVGEDAEHGRPAARDGGGQGAPAAQLGRARRRCSGRSSMAAGSRSFATSPATSAAERTVWTPRIRSPRTASIDLVRLRTPRRRRPSRAALATAPAATPKLRGKLGQRLQHVAAAGAQRDLQARTGRRGRRSPAMRAIAYSSSTAPAAAQRAQHRGRVRRAAAQAGRHRDPLVQQHAARLAQRLQGAGDQRVRKPLDAGRRGRVQLDRVAQVDRHEQRWPAGGSRRHGAGPPAGRG